ncbi:MAG: exodeoxyribonuclease VII small subunit [Lachnospiraceae bacterium]|nr:exodeoxyribonuclease VII small subunit [Lachnospiraceae bacterium]
MKHEGKQMEEAGKQQPPSLTIEETFEELEGILEMLEDEESSLEESFRYFERGMKLVKSCSAQIDKVEKQIFVLSEDEEDA